MRINNDKHISWQIETNAYRQWLGNRSHSLGRKFDLSRPTIRGVVCLALLDLRDRPVSYEEINEAVRRKGAVTLLKHGKKNMKGPIPLPTLRVALSDFKKSLVSNESPFQLKTIRRGREVQIQLVNHQPRVAFELGHETQSSNPVFRNLKSLALSLVRDGGGLPFANLYTTYRAAAWWLSSSTKTGLAKRSYEARSLDHYGLREQLAKRSKLGKVGFVSLAPGEGLGEVEILQRLLHAKKGEAKLKVEYVAIDSSDILMMSHTKLVEEIFEEELKSGQLSFSPLVGNLYELGDCLETVRARHGSDFLNDLPTLVTFLGNCIGNNENQEWTFFRTVTAALPNVFVSILVGLSLVRQDTDGTEKNEKYTMEPFVLETARHLLHDIKALRSMGVDGKDISDNSREFVLEEGVQKYIPSFDYCTMQQIEGRVYRFFYTLKHRLETRDGNHALDAGQKVLLYSIIKYRLPSFVQALRNRGLSVNAPAGESEILTISEGEEVFRYAVIAANSEPLSQK